MKMQPGDYQIYGVGSDYIWVVSGLLTYSMEWPDRIVNRGKTYKFGSNEPMDEWMIGVWGGHAKYIEVKE